MADFERRQVEIGLELYWDVVFLIPLKVSAH